MKKIRRFIIAIILVIFLLIYDLCSLFNYAPPVEIESNREYIAFMSFLNDLKGGDIDAVSILLMNLIIIGLLIYIIIKRKKD